jgi:hypothetical protein
MQQTFLLVTNSADWKSLAPVAVGTEHNIMEPPPVGKDFIESSLLESLCAGEYVLIRVSWSLPPQHGSSSGFGGRKGSSCGG